VQGKKPDGHIYKEDLSNLRGAIPFTKMDNISLDNVEDPYTAVQK
jgi:hypothetical protein